MKLVLITLLLTFAQTTSDENTFVSDCLEAEETEFINTIVELFEKQLINKYGNDSYQQFLSEMKGMAIPPDFFVKSDLTEFLMRNKTSPMFREIWIENAGSFNLNYESKYFECLKEKSDSPTLTEILETVEKVPNLSPGLIAGALESELKEGDYNSEAIRTYVAINIYSEFAINIYDKFTK